jgi:hypothetical protein
MLLQEILNVEYLPVTWLSDTIGTFDFNDKQFGIIFQEYDITLKPRILDVVNISFGLVIDTSKPISATNIDRTLTKFGKPRTILATVGHACVDNPKIKAYDLIVIAASDQAKEKRFGVYGLAINELITKLPEYKNVYHANTANGTILTVISRITLTQAESDYIGKEILGKE